MTTEQIRNMTLSQITNRGLKDIYAPSDHQIRKESEMKFQMDPDFRRDVPETGPYCAHCQRPVNPKTAVAVTVDWDTWQVTEGGEEFIGPDCWKTLKRL